LNVIVKNDGLFEISIEELRMVIPPDGNEYSIPENIAYNYRSSLTYIRKEQTKEECDRSIAHSLIKNDTNEQIKECIRKKQPFVTFVMACKDLDFAGSLSIINSLQTKESIKYFNFIIVQNKITRVHPCKRKPVKHDFYNSFNFRNFVTTHYYVNVKSARNRSMVLNYGFKRVRTPLIAIWNQDFIFSKDFLRTYLKMIEETNFNNSFLSMGATELYDTEWHGQKIKQYEVCRYFTTYNKDHVFTVKGFDESFVNYGYEDEDFNRRLHRCLNVTSCTHQARHIIYHISHSDRSKKYPQSICNNFNIMNSNTMHDLNILPQEWGECQLLKIRNVSLSDTLIVLGNSFSLGNFDIRRLTNDRYHVIGMNDDYHYWYKINWFPMYHACFEHMLTKKSEKNIKALIEDEKSPIKQHFLLNRITTHEKLKVLEMHGHYGSVSDKFETFGYGGCAAVNCCQVGLCLGYKKIVLVGIKGAIDKITNLAWIELVKLTRNRKIEIINCNMDVVINGIKNQPVEDVINFF